MSLRLPAYFVRVKSVIYRVDCDRAKIDKLKTEKWVNLIRVSEIKVFYDDQTLMQDRKIKILTGDMDLLQFPIHVIHQHSAGETWILDVSHSLRQ